MSTLLMFSFVTIAIFYILPHSFRRFFLVIMGLAFYALIDIKMLMLLVLTIVWIWYFAQRTHKKIYIGIIPLVVILAFFKINQFFVAEAGTLLESLGIGAAVQTLALMMPMGISYYIFKAISYIVDTSKGKYAADKDILNIALYISFFPEIQSGPISRYDEFVKSLSTGLEYDDIKFQRGVYLIIKGLFMKTVVANRLVGFTDAVFSNPSGYNGIALWLGAFFYTIQLYCDFAGYSSIVSGITQILGMHRIENFRRPYVAASISEFWDRWHISLSTWLRDYIYFPLGGSRLGKIRTKINLFIVFLISGIWHGSGIQYMIWGGYHGILRVITPRKKIERQRFIHTFLTFILVSFGWIVFRSNSISLCAQYIIRMFTEIHFSVSSVQSAILPFTNDNTCIAFFLTAMIFIVVLFIRELYEEKHCVSTDSIPSVSWQVFLLASVILFGNLRVSSFIYANF